MKKIIFNNIDECIYKEALSNGIDIYYYPTTKTKNFYITISVKYGAGIKEYSIDGKHYKKIIPGSAHFLEHKIMNFTNRPKMMKIINELGLYANAYTSYELTNYNIFGSKDSLASLKLLLDLFYNPLINQKNVENEKGIIIEEFKMYNDNPNFRINRTICKNIFKNSFLNDVLVGNINEINKINEKDLNKIYKDFYRPNNTFIIITGNINKLEMSSYLNEYMKNIKNSKSVNIKIKKSKEIKNVLIPYSEIEESITIPKVIYSLKIRKKDLAAKDNILKRLYLNFLFSSLFSNTSDIYEKYKSSELMVSMNHNITNAEEDYLVNLLINTNKPNEILSILKEDLKKPKISEETFNRKKKMFINNIVLSFENIEDVEYIITNNIIRAGRIINDTYDILMNMNYKDFSIFLKSIDFKNYSITKIIPKK